MTAAANDVIIPDEILDSKFAFPQFAEMPAHKFCSLMETMVRVFQEFHNYNVENRVAIDSEQERGQLRLLTAALKLISTEYFADDSQHLRLRDTIIEYDRFMMRSGNYGRKTNKTVLTSFGNFIRKHFLSETGVIVSPT